MSYLPALREAALDASPQQEHVSVRNPARAMNSTPRRLDVGRQGRDLFLGLRLWRRARYPYGERLYWYLLKPVFALAVILWYTPQYARAVKRRYGVSIGQQIARQLALGFR